MAQPGLCPNQWSTIVCEDDSGNELWDCEVCWDFGPNPEFGKEYIRPTCDYQMCEDEEGNMFQAPFTCPTGEAYDVHYCIDENKNEHWDAERCDLDDGTYYLSYPECPYDEDDGFADPGMCYTPTEEEMIVPVPVEEPEPEVVEEVVPEVEVDTFDYTNYYKCACDIWTHWDAVMAGETECACPYIDCDCPVFSEKWLKGEKCGKTCKQWYH